MSVSRQTPLSIGPWQADPSTNSLWRGDELRPVEPKVMDLLVLLAGQPGRVFAREEIVAALWPGVIVGDDALARCVFKLRRALDDDSRSPAYVETIPKRGYRLLVPAREARAAASPRRRWQAAALALVLMALIGIAALFAWTRLVPADPAPLVLVLARADDSYFQYTRAENERAIALYRRVLAADPGSAAAMAGLASALVQREIRWPEGLPAPPQPSVRAARASGALSRPAAAARIARADALVSAARRRAPDDARVLRAFGLVRATGGHFEEAAAAYDEALRHNPDDWGSMINRAEMFDAAGQPAPALALLERAYLTMARDYRDAPAHIRPWQSRLGADIARRHAAAGRTEAAERWYRQVLTDAPFDAGATAALAAMLKAGGRGAEATQLCTAFKARTGSACAP